MKSILSILIAMFLFSSQLWAADTSVMKSIPMQDAGRNKPYDSFARETLMLVYGKSTFNDRPAYEIIFTWFLLPEAWAQKEIVQIKQFQLKESLKLDKERKYFSYQELMANERLPLLFQELSGKQQMREKLDPYFQSIQSLGGQLETFRAVTEGSVFRLVPPKEGTKWLSVHEDQFPAEMMGRFQKVTSSFIHLIGTELKENDPAKVKAMEDQLRVATNEFVAAAREINPQIYPTDKEIGVEVHYNDLDPFKWAWIFYLLGALVLGFAWYTEGRKTYIFSWALLIVGFLLHTYGFGLRVYIAGRPPVSNMYETVVWVSWGAMVFSFIIEAVYKQRFILMCGAIGAIFCLVLASLAPSILDASIRPLEPVLVSNFWLLIHVLTITISYSAFLLAFVLGDIGLAMAIMNEEKYKEVIRNISNAIYRAIQIGVVLVAAGTILGGIWADYSWGRFWGWDPKETWALIVLLGYLAVLHGRLAGWLGPFGMMTSAIIAFSLVIMAWYGVNFVLGAGLHTYGFGGGGVQYVSGFVGLHMIYVIYAIVARQRSQRNSPKGGILS